METDKMFWIQKLGRITKGLIITYLFTGGGLLLLAFLLLKFQLNEAKVSAGIIGIYVLANITGGIYIGKKTEQKRYLWGIFLGTVYWGILMAITFFCKTETGQGIQGGFLTLLICTGSAALGAMLAGV